MRQQVGVKVLGNLTQGKNGVQCSGLHCMTAAHVSPQTGAVVCSCSTEHTVLLDSARNLLNDISGATL